MAIWSGSLFSGHPHKGILDLAFEDPFKILLVMADQVVLRFVDESDFEKQGKGYLCGRFVELTYPNQRPQRPSLSPYFLLIECNVM